MLRYWFGKFPAQEVIIAASGEISAHKLRFGVEAGVGQGITGSAQGILGTAVTGTYQRATQ